MNIRDILGGLVLLALVANVVDLLLTGRPGFYHFPHSGRWLYVLKIGSILVVVFAVLSLFRLFPGVWFAVTGAAYFASLQAYAIFLRHTKARATP